jgi:AraC-like DNA-binding protein
MFGCFTTTLPVFEPPVLYFGFCFMQMTSYLPGPLVSPYIERYLIIRSENSVVNRVLPGASLVMSFRFQGSICSIEDDRREALPSAVLSGVRKSGRKFGYGEHTGNLLVLFKEGGAHAFLREPLHEMACASLPLQEFSGYHQAAEMLNRLTEAYSDADKIDLIERYLTSRLINPLSDRLVRTAMEQIKLENGNLRIRSLAERLAISQDALEKRFRKIVGIPPKQFAFVVRMNSVIRQMSNHIPLSELALDSGYFDQPHFNKDFRLFTGQSPTDFQKSTAFW